MFSRKEVKLVMKIKIFMINSPYFSSSGYVTYQLRSPTLLKQEKQLFSQNKNKISKIFFADASNTSFTKPRGDRV